MKKIVSVFFLTLLFACSGDNSDAVEEVSTNNAPKITSQTFEVDENVKNSFSIGFLVAQDTDGDKVRFMLDLSEKTKYGVIINSETGEIKVSDAELFDYETNQSITVPVIAFDAEAQSKTEVVINILDVEDGPLSNREKAFIDEFRYVTYNLSPTSFGAPVSEKWKGTMNLFLDGDISTSYRLAVQETLNEFNAYFSDGFQIVLVETVQESDVHAVRGPLVSVKDIFPSLHDAASQGNFYGYALYTGDENYNIDAGQVWLRNGTDMALFKHEIGHIIGMGHANGDYCGSLTVSNSVMCSNPGPEFTAIEKGILRGLYHPEITTGKTFSELKPILEKLVLNGTLEL